MAQRLTAATCLAAAISAALGSASLAAMNPSPLSLIGAVLPTQDEESEVDEFADDASAGDEAMAETEDTAGDAEEVAADEPAAEEAAAEVEPSEELPQDEPEEESEPESADTAMHEDAAESTVASEPLPPPEPPAPPPPEATATPQAPVPVTPAGRSASGGDEREDTTIYKVVVNHEEQYSIWPADRENPLGWNDAGKSGNKQECLDYIKEVWTDMRPISLRKKMEEMERERQNGGQ